MVRLSIRFITSMFALILCLGCFQLPLEQRAKGPFDAVYEWHDDVMKVTVFNMSDGIALSGARISPSFVQETLKLRGAWEIS